MRNINNVTLSGRLVRDAEMTVLQSGDQVLNFNICVNGSKRTKEGAYEDYPMYFNVKHFVKNVLSLNQYLLKGTLVCVSGELYWSQWEKDGQKRQKVDVIARQVQLCGSKRDNTAENDTPAQAESSVPEEEYDSIPF